MDEIGAFLAGPRARGAFVLRTVMEPPWALHIEDGAPLAIVVMVTGQAVIRPDGGQPVRLGPGHVALVRGPEPYLFADDADTPVAVRILPGQVCVTPSGDYVGVDLALGLRSWGNRPDGATVMLVGVYESDGAISRRLTDALPPVASLGPTEWSSPVLPLLLAEVDQDRPGQQVVLDRLLDLVVIDALRAWFDRADDRKPRWFAAQGDPIVGPVLRLMHEQLAEPWTIASLARATGTSRAVLARRFTEQVGEPPMSYLTSWRMAVAADLLLEPGASVGSVSRQVGYASPFTFSTAFKREHGHRPKDHRAAQAREAVSSVSG